MSGIVKKISSNPKLPDELEARKIALKEEHFLVETDSEHRRTEGLRNTIYYITIGSIVILFLGIVFIFGSIVLHILYFDRNYWMSVEKIEILLTFGFGNITGMFLKPHIDRYFKNN